MSLTGPPPPVPAAVAAATAGTDPVTGTPIVLGILDARGPDRLTTSVSDVLHAASGPGNIVTGKVAEIRPDGTVYLTTPLGAELSFHHPPEVPIDVGSTVTLRLVAIVPAPQAVLLAVDGRSVSGLLARTGNAARQGVADTPVTPTPQPGPPAANAIPQRSAGPADLGFGISSALVATLGQEADTARRPIPGATGAPVSAWGTAASAGPAEGADGSPRVIAVLARTAPPRPGVSAPPLGTRYLLSVTAVATTAGEATPSVDAPSSALPNLATAPDPSAETTTPPPRDATIAPTLPAPPASDAAPDLTEFTPQAALLAGRVVAPRQGGDVMVETSVGTLALPHGAYQIPVGSAVHLRVVAVARPLPTAAAPQVASPASVAATLSTGALANPPQSPVQEAVAILASLQPELARAATDAFVLPPGSQLAALIFRFLAGVQGGAPRRWAESPARAALDALDHRDLSDRLDSDAAAIGSQSLPADPNGWKVTILPYLGVESMQPARLYQRATEIRVEDDGTSASQAGQRFVVEIELRRLGPLQFDGLVRERRFDLAVRTTQPLDSTLQAEIGHIFRETIGIGGYAGDLVFGKLARFPLLPITVKTGVHELNA